MTTHTLKEAAQQAAPIYYMRDDHTFNRLSNDVPAALMQIEADLNAGHNCGMLCSKRTGFQHIHAGGPKNRVEFLRQCEHALRAALAAQPCNHVLYKTEDTDKPEAICDRNGEVVLGMCKMCGKAEIELLAAQQAAPEPVAVPLPPGAKEHFEGILDRSLSAEALTFKEAIVWAFEAWADSLDLLPEAPTQAGPDEDEDEPYYCPTCGVEDGGTSCGLLGCGLVTGEQAAPDEVVRDAERYRWLRDGSLWPAVFIDWRTPVPIVDQDLDAAIDAAMARKGGEV